MALIDLLNAELPQIMLPLFSGEQSLVICMIVPFSVLYLPTPPHAPQLSTFKIWSLSLVLSGLTAICLCVYFFGIYPALNHQIFESVS